MQVFDEELVVGFPLLDLIAVKVEGAIRDVQDNGWRKTGKDCRLPGLARSKISHHKVVSVAGPRNVSSRSSRARRKRLNYSRILKHSVASGTNESASDEDIGSTIDTEDV